MVSPLSTSRPVFGLASRKASSSLSSPASAAARLSSRGATARCTPRAPLNSSMRLHRSTNFGSAWGAARALAAENNKAALSSFIFFDGTDIERRDDLGDFLGDEARGDRRAVVVQDRDQARRVDAGVVDEQGLDLRIAVLLDDEDFAVRGHEVEELVLEREAADSQCVDENALRGKGLQSLMHRRAGRAVVDAAEARRHLGRGQNRLRNQGLRVLELLLQALHVIDVVRA